MCKVVVHPITNELFLQEPDGGSLVTFGGTNLNVRRLEEAAGKPISEWPVAGEVVSLADWHNSDRAVTLRQYVVAQVWTPFPKPKGTQFHAGGPMAYIATWTQEQKGNASYSNAYLRRDAARLKAEVLGGVAW